MTPTVTKREICSLVFAVSDRTKAYYTYNGISQYIDIEKEESYAWYKNFLMSEKPYVLDVDTDAANNWALSVFINTAVNDENNKLLGVCGVGIDMQELQALLARYERIYDIKIDLIDKNGLIMVDTDAERIERDSIDIMDLSDYADGECYYEILPNGSRTITYLKHLDWYLVVQNDHVWLEQVSSIIMPGLVCMGLCFVVLVFSVKYGIVDTKHDKE